MQRSRHAIGAAVLTGLLLVSDTTAFAQSAAGAGPSGSLSGSPGGTGLSMPPSSEPPLGVERPGTALRPTTGRRPNRRVTRGPRRPTALLAEMNIRPTMTSPGTAFDVQPPLSGIPAPYVSIRPTLLDTVAGPSIAQPVRRPSPEDDPFAPLGVRLGGLTLFPALSQSVGYDTNPNRVALRRESFVSQTEGELGIQSDWTRHALSGSLRGAYSEYPSAPGASRPEGSGKIGLRLDVERDTIVNIDTRFNIDTQRGDSANLASSVRERPVVYSEGASVGVTQRFNRLIATLQGTLDRTDFEDAITLGGTRIDQSDRNVTQYGARGRLGYEVSPGFVPFVEALGDTRIYDRRIDDSGFARSSDGVGGRVGTTFELSRLVTGEIGAGVMRRTYEDRRLGSLTSPLADVALLWSLSSLTTVKATASATIDETTVAGANGVRALRAALEVSHALRRNFIITGALTAVDYAYNGTRLNEHGFGASLRADYKINRILGVRASYAYERLDSQFPGSSYASNTFLLGMRLTP